MATRQLKRIDVTFILLAEARELVNCSLSGLGLTVPIRTNLDQSGMSPGKMIRALNANHENNKGFEYIPKS